MKKSLAIAIATVTATLSALSLGITQPVEAQTRCWWEGRQMRCQNERDINNRNDYYNRNRNDYYNRNRNDYYNRNRSNPTHNEGGYYEDWRRENHSNNNDGGYYEDWRRNNRNYSNYNRYNSGYYNNRAINESELRRSINEIYRQQLGRNADWDGIRHYTDQYRNGWSLGQIRNDIANSNEARYRYRRY